MITVTITRFGGIAGIARSWLLELEPDEWDRLSARGGFRPDPQSRDRFVYRITAEEQVLEIPESRWDESCRSMLRRADPLTARRDGGDGPSERPAPAEPNRRDGSPDRPDSPA